MADPHQLSDQEAARRRRLWLQERHAQARELVVLLLRYAPEVEVARVLDQLPAADLHRLARLLAHASGTQQPQGRPAGRDATRPERIVRGDTAPLKSDPSPGWRTSAQRL